MTGGLHDLHGKVVLKKRLRRKQVVELIRQLEEAPALLTARTKVAARPGTPLVCEATPLRRSGAGASAEV